MNIDLPTTLKVVQTFVAAARPLSALGSNVESAYEVGGSDVSCETEARLSRATALVIAPWILGTPVAVPLSADMPRTLKVLELCMNACAGFCNLLSSFETRLLLKELQSICS